MAKKRDKIRGLSMHTAFFDDPYNYEVGASTYNGAVKGPSYLTKISDPVSFDDGTPVPSDVLHQGEPTPTGATPFTDPGYLSGSGNTSHESSPQDPNPGVCTAMLNPTLAQRLRLAYQALEMARDALKGITIDDVDAHGSLLEDLPDIYRAIGDNAAALSDMAEVLRSDDLAAQDRQGVEACQHGSSSVGGQVTMGPDGVSNLHVHASDGSTIRWPRDLRSP
jgi:hypothetical protein